MSKGWENRLRGMENGYFLKKDQEALSRIIEEMETRRQLEALKDDQGPIIYKEVDIERCPETGKLALSTNEASDPEVKSKRKIRMLDLKRLLSFN